VTPVCLSISTSDIDNAVHRYAPLRRSREETGDGREARWSQVRPRP